MSNDHGGWKWGRLLAGVALGVLSTGCYVGADAPTPAEPRSLAGVDVDGSLTLSESGQFVFDEDARALFDHFLAAEGEVDDEGLHARVRQEIEQRLGGEAVEQAWDAFSRYVDYRRRMAELAQDYAGSDPEAAAESMTARMAQIRAETIGEAPGVDDEAPRVRVALAMRTVLEDPSLAEDARAQRLAALQGQLGEAPDPEAPSRILTRIHEALRPIPPDDVEARRDVLNALVGEAAAERWLRLEQRRAEALVAGG